MRIGHLVFCLFLAVEVSPMDEKFRREADNFIQSRIVPHLFLNGVKDVDFNKLRFCLCSAEIGCNTRSNGWLPSIGFSMSAREKILYRNTCVTDGDCYQNALPHPLMPIYGCMDASSRRGAENEFHDLADKVCINTTKNNVPNYWICCNNDHFCANETVVNAPPKPRYIYSVPLVILVLIGAIIASACIIALCYRYRRPLFIAPLEKYDFIQKKLLCRDVEMNSNLTNETNIDESTNNPLVDSELLADNAPVEMKNDDQMNTMSTSIGASAPQLEPAVQATVKPQPKPIDTLKAVSFLEESYSGSGAGPTRLHPVTMGQQIFDLSPCGSGRFGSVSRGYYKGEAVAVKIFKSNDDQPFKKELDIYETRMLRHPNVLRYIGSDRVDVDMTIQLWLVTEYHPHGSLYDFLKTHVIDLTTFFKLMASMTNGLNFLHMASTANNVSSSKPPIAHRDLKSRNILVKHDLTCAIGDLGLSLCRPDDFNVTAVVGPRYKCGTVRYLAPEILNSSMAASIFDSYLQADIYAQSLVIWESLCRVEQDNIVAKDAEEVIPYGDCISREPSEEQMQKVVCGDKRRPEINELWKTHETISQILEFLSTCWSENPSARLNAYQCKKFMEDKYNEYVQKHGSSTNSPLLKQESDPKKKEHETVSSKTFTPRGNQVHDQGMKEPRNGRYTGQDDAKNPLLG